MSNNIPDWQGGQDKREYSFVHVLTPESSDLTKIVKTTFNNILFERKVLFSKFFIEIKNKKKNTL